MKRSYRFYETFVHSFVENLKRDASTVYETDSLALAAVVGRLEGIIIVALTSSRDDILFEVMESTLIRGNDDD